MTAPKLAIIELNMDSGNLNENTLVFLYGDFLKNRERYTPMDKLIEDQQQRYEFGPHIIVGDIIEDISDPEDSVIIYGDGVVCRCLQGFSQYKGRKIGISSLKDEPDASDIIVQAMKNFSIEGES